LNDVVVLYELATTGGGASLFRGLAESDVIFQHAVNGFPDQLASILPVSVATSRSRASFSAERWTSMP
jgi:hypothetical protein